MGDIELVIKIPEEIRLALINNIQLSIDQQSICDSCIKQAIINGTLLPKGHGRLIDGNEIEWFGCTIEECPYKDRECKDCNSAHCSKLQIDKIHTIIEADIESEG